MAAPAIDPSRQAGCHIEAGVKQGRVRLRAEAVDREVAAVPDPGQCFEIVGIQPADPVKAAGQRHSGDVRAGPALPVGQKLPQARLDHHPQDGRRRLGFAGRQQGSRPAKPIPQPLQIGFRGRPVVRLRRHHQAEAPVGIAFDGVLDRPKVFQIPRIVPAPDLDHHHLVAASSHQIGDEPLRQLVQPGFDQRLVPLAPVSLAQMAKELSFHRLGQHSRSSPPGSHARSRKCRRSPPFKQFDEHDVVEQGRSRSRCSLSAHGRVDAGPNRSLLRANETIMTSVAGKTAYRLGAAGLPGAAIPERPPPPAVDPDQICE